MTAKTRVMLTTEGTYPFHQGGVSTWCDIMVRNLPEYEFVVYSIIMNPYVTQKFTLPSNTELIKVPLWGTEEPSEHLAIPFSQIYLSKKRTTDAVIQEEFLPLFEALIHEFTVTQKDASNLGRILLKMHCFFEAYEYKVAFKSQIIWDAFKKIMIEKSLTPGSGFNEPTIFAMTQSLGWIYRFLNVVNTQLPDVDVTHSGAAAFCGIPCVLAKLRYGTPFILTEHGVYLREQYFSLSQRGYISYMNTFLIRMIRSIVDLNYYYADQVSPVCYYNTRWEKEFGVKQKHIQVIYNGVDKTSFVPKVSEVKRTHPVVVSVARIDPLKDILTLIQAAKEVIHKVPNATFLIYGAVSVQGYYEECLELVETLGLKEQFIFKGHVKDVPEAYRSGDIVVLSSISEAFPYSVVEAMLVGKPVVATDVGGIREAVGDTGILVDPRSPEQLAEGIVKLLLDNELREEFSRDARNRALNLFTFERFLNGYRESYRSLAAGIQVVRDLELIQLRVTLELHKAYSLMALDEYAQAVACLKRAIRYKPDVSMTIEMMSMLVKLYGLLDQTSDMQLWQEKIVVLKMLETEKVG